ncbi:MAG: hypothetical protein U1F09_04710 [Steroidobacteraceae bacterium]
MNSDVLTQPPPASPNEPASLADKVAHLKRLVGSGDATIETHFAWIFLVGDRALKLRKPVRRDTMDYSTIAARHADAEDDVRLNRRLAPGVYLRVVPLVRRADGTLTAGGSGETVDWLVEMRRLDRTLFLDVMLARGAVRPAALDDVAGLLAGFYAAAEPAITGPGQLGARLAAQVAANALAIESLDVAKSRGLATLQSAAIAALAAELDARARDGCVVEGHGDLRPEHVLLSSPPLIIDCLEFDRDLRILDRAEELCVLELECARIGHAAAGRRLLDACLAKLGDEPSARLLDLYRSHRAARKAKIYIWRSAEPDGGTPDEWRARAADYLETALAAALRAAH